jgi:two-component system, sensor histidine kinase and response regulator
MPLSNIKTTTYYVVTIGLVVSYLATYNSSWHGSAEIHTLMESIATVLGLFVGAISLIRFYSLGGITYLILGAGFIGVACLDGYHAVVTSIWFKGYLPSKLISLIPWSWFASRLFLSMVVLASFLIIKLKLEEKSPKLLSTHVVYGATALTTICSFIFFAFVPLGSGYYDNWVFNRPEEFIPGIFFLIAFIGHYQLGNWRNDEFEHWLLIAIIINLAAQIVFMPFSSELFDIEFDVAHILKKASYICLLIGLSISVYNAFKQVKSEVEVRKRAQLALEASEVRNRTLMTSLIDGLITINDTGIIETINVAACDLFGYSKLELLGKNIKILMPNPYHDEHDDYLSNYKKTGITNAIGSNTEAFGLKKDGTIFPMNLSVSEMVIGGIKKYSGIVRDDTERKNSEEKLIAARNKAEHAAQAKSNFLATMSHEIRTPMNGVIGMTELLRGTQLSIEQKDIVSTISESGQSLLNIINDILELSKIEAGKIDLYYISFNLERTVYDVIRLLSFNAEQKNIELNFHYHVNCPRYIVGDAGRIRQVILNLVGNAIKFTRKGHVIVEISSIKQDDIHHTLRIEIQDTGIGIDEEEKHKLFESFTQADDSTSREFGGTGLGLTICKQLVELMNGKIDVDSQLGKGSNFWFEIPVSEAESPVQANTAELNDIHVMIVCSNKSSSSITKEQLNNWNMHVDEVTDTQQVIPIMLAACEENNPYHIILINNDISDFNCQLLGQQIKEDENINKVPLILLALFADQGSASKYKEIGYSAYLSKPIFSDLLYETIKQSLELDLHSEEVSPLITKHSIHEDKLNNINTDIQLSGNILLVEDVIVNQLVATGLMSGYNLNVDIANNGQEAIEKQQQKQYDLILMDCQMPIMDGFDATRKIREMGDKTTIIALTANALSSDREKCLNAGMNDYLAKPYNREQLISILDKWLNRTTTSTDSVNTIHNDPENNQADQPAPISKEKLAEMQKIMGELFKELIPAFIEQSDNFINNMLDHLNNNQLDILERHAHSMKSSSLNVGATPLSNLSMILEEMARNNEDTDLLREKIIAISTEYARVKQALKEYTRVKQALKEYT